MVKASLALTNHWGRKGTFFFSLKALSLLRKRKGVGIKVAYLDRLLSLLLL